MFTTLNNYMGDSEMQIISIGVKDDQSIEIKNNDRSGDAL